MKNPFEVSARISSLLIDEARIERLKDLLVQVKDEDIPHFTLPVSKLMDLCDSSLDGVRQKIHIMRKK